MAKGAKYDNWYKDFFQDFYLEMYEDVLSSLRTREELSFIIEALNLPKNSKILDLCGGYGRLSVPLAKKGFNVYVQDLNKSFLKKAKNLAKKEKAEIKTIHADMRKIPYINEFDAVINIFTSFGYLENNKENMKVLNAVNKALKPGGKFLIDILNGEWLSRYHSPRTWRKVGDILVLEESRLEPRTKNNYVDIQVVDLKKFKLFSLCRKLKLYNSKELEKALIGTGFKIVQKYGSFKKEKFSPKFSKRIIILAKKAKK